MAGFDAVGWDASVWVLHSMYEEPSKGYELTHDDLRRQRIAAGLESPIILPGVNLSDDTTVLVGNALGMSERPQGVEVVRLLWRDLAARLGFDLDHNDVPPCYRWFPYQSWPVGIAAADEGSLDAESLDALVDLLAERSPLGRSTRCVAHYGALATGDFDTVWMRRVLLGDIASLVDASDGRSGSPSNWWPEDRSWFVYTDWDLWGTKVSGSRELIDAIANDERLETIAWHRPEPPTR